MRSWRSCKVFVFSCAQMCKLGGSTQFAYHIRITAPSRPIASAKVIGLLNAIAEVAVSMFGVLVPIAVSNTLVPSHQSVSDAKLVVEFAEDCQVVNKVSIPTTLIPAVLPR